MASTKSAATLDRETGERVVKRETIASLRAQLAEVSKERDFFKANSLRKEGIIQMLQKKVERQAKPASRLPSADERAAFFAAHPDRKTASAEEIAAYNS